MAANWHCSNYREVMKIIWMTIQNLARTHRLPRRRTRGRRTRSRGRTTHPPGPTWPAAPSPSASCSLGILCRENTRGSAAPSWQIPYGLGAQCDPRAGWQGPLDVLGAASLPRARGMRREREWEEEDEEEAEEEEEENEPVLTSVFRRALGPPRLSWACLTARTTRCPFILASGRIRKKKLLIMVLTKGRNVVYMFENDQTCVRILGMGILK